MKFAICTSRDERTHKRPLSDCYTKRVSVRWQDQPTTLRGEPYREGYWYVEVSTIEDLLDLVREYDCAIIVDAKEHAGVFDPVDVDTLLVYDGYIE